MKQIFTENKVNITTTNTRKKPERKTRTVRVFIRLLPEEKNLFEHMCQIAGVTQADYFRIRCLDQKPLRKRRRPDLDTKALCRLLSEFGRIGNNLNQMARKANSGYVPANDNLVQLQAQVKAMRQELHAALKGETQ